jgi:GT2 family glycosyltransferase
LACKRLRQTRKPVPLSELNDVPVHLIILNFNGRELLAECLPSVLLAAASSRHLCDVCVLDNGSSDGSAEFLRAAFPEVRVVERPNLGLCSFNQVLADLTGRVAILLNNDIKLAGDCIDALVGPLFAQKDHTHASNACFMTAPLCWLFDGKTHEGLQAAVEWRWGLVRTTIDFQGNEPARYAGGLTAAAGPVLAVDRRVFLELGGFDPLYLPGRLEDLDFAFRGYQAGYVARYVPAAVAYHKGQVSFDAAYGQDASLALALRNTLLFQWKNLRHPWHIARHLFALCPRLVFDVLRAPFTPQPRRLAFARALCAALAKLPLIWRNQHRPRRSWRREREFFRCFDPRRLAGDAALACAARPSRTARRHANEHSPVVSVHHGSSVTR